MPSASWPTAATMSSCGRPLLRDGAGATPRCTSWPVTQLVRSMSWVARSITTPTSAIRCGNGPWRRVTTWKTSPSSPASSRVAQALQRRVVALDVADAGDQAARLERVHQPPGRRRRTCASGFSISAHDAGLGQLAGRPPRAARSGRRPPRSRRRGRAAPSTVGTTGTPRSVPVWSPAGSTTPTSSTPPSPDSTRAWLRPIAPEPDQAGAQLAPALTAHSATVVGGVGDPLELARRSATGRTGSDSTSAAARSVSGRSQRGRACRRRSGTA